jgi:hypothetical protein
MEGIRVGRSAATDLLGVNALYQQVNAAAPDTAHEHG